MLGLPFSPDASRTYDVIVVGGGIVGACITRALTAYKDIDVLLLEKGIELAMGATKANSGIVHAGGHADPDLLKGQFVLEGNRMFGEFAKELGFGYRQIGEYIIALNEEERAHVLQLYQDCTSRGIECELVEADELKRREPNINPSALCGLYYPSAKVINPYEATMQIGLCAAHNGASIGLGREVVSISPTSLTSSVTDRLYRVDARLVEGAWFYPEHSSLFTDEGLKEKPVVHYTGRIVINCCGNHCDKVSQSFIDALYALDPEKYPAILDYYIQPRKGQEFLMNTNIFNSVLFPTPNKITKGTLIIPTADGNTMIGPTAEDAPLDFTALTQETDPRELGRTLDKVLLRAKFNTGTTGAGFNTVFESAMRLASPDIMKEIRGTYFATFGGNRPVLRRMSSISKEDTLLEKELAKYHYSVGESVKMAPAFAKEIFGEDVTNMQPVDNDFLIRSLFMQDFIEFSGIQSPGLTSGPSLALYACKLVGHILQKKRGHLNELKAVVPIEHDRKLIVDSLELNMHSSKFSFKKYFDRETNNTKNEFHPYVQPIKLANEFGDGHKHLQTQDLEDLEVVDQMENPIICKCESISYRSLLSAFRHGARSLDGFKHRTRQGMGVCQGGFCGPRALGILAEELKKMYSEFRGDNASEPLPSYIPAVSKCGNGSYLIGGGYKADRKPVINNFPEFNRTLGDIKEASNGEIKIIIVGGGPAGLGALLGLLDSVILYNMKNEGHSTLDVEIFDRNPSPGGILIQCIHSGFGLAKFQKELTGPEYGESLWNLVLEKVHKLEAMNEDKKGKCVNVVIKPHFGCFVENCYFNKEQAAQNDRYVVEYSFAGNTKKERLLVSRSAYLFLCTGSRERPPPSIFLWNTTRDIGGVYTAGMLQRMLNNEGYSVCGNETGSFCPSKLNGKFDLYGFKHISPNVYSPQRPFKCVILGSGDIGLIMVRRLKYNFAESLARETGEKQDPFSAIHINVYEIKPTISGLRRNVLTCCEDNCVSIRCNTTVVGVKCIESDLDKSEHIEAVESNAGTHMRRISAVTLKDFKTGEVWDEECDLLVLSVGLQQDVEVNTRYELNKARANPECSKVPVRSIIDYKPPLAPLVTPSLSVSLADYFSKTGSLYVPTAEDDNSLFICGNSLHIHDLADCANAEGSRVGMSVGTRLLQHNKDLLSSLPLKPVSLDNIFYVIPRNLPYLESSAEISSIDKVVVSFRVLSPMAFCDIVLAAVVKAGEVEETVQVFKVARTNVEPAEMEVIPIPLVQFKKAREQIDSLTKAKGLTSYNVSYKLSAVSTGERVIPEGATVLTCITCPNGCTLIVQDKQGNAEVSDIESMQPKTADADMEDRYIVTGNRCPRGAKYAREELTAPRRQFSLSVNVPNIGMVPVKPEAAVPKAELEAIISHVVGCERRGEFNGLKQGATSIRMGDTLLTVPTAHGTVNMIACRSFGRE